MALPLVNAVQPQCVVYDCMDELSAFKDAPRQLRQRESALLKRAAVVLTGGPSLYEARRDLHPHVVCLPSAVDAAHFAAAAAAAPTDPHAAEAHRLQSRLPRPLLGFFGVIDERLDTELVAGIAEARPDWTVVMVGPVVKITPESLPRRPNLHWLGMQPYERLPHLLAGWDIALMPFALNESTRFISPTKTLEYLAGGKPVVSTAIADVVSLYGDTVAIAPDAAGFVKACDALLAEDDLARARRREAMAATVARHGWDDAADTVHGLLSQALRLSRPGTVVEALAAESAPMPLAAVGGGRL
jgi:glycosyltransferase involved in cell wall biosynthesis